MTVFTGVTKADAQEMVAKGGRILKHYLDAERNPVCDVDDGEWQNTQRNRGVPHYDTEEGEPGKAPLPANHPDVVAMATALPEMEDDVPVAEKPKRRNRAKKD